MGSNTVTGKTPFRFQESGPALIILLIALVFRLAFVLKGGSFIATPLSFAYQYLDPVLLKNALLRSLLYLHSQPPLFNLFLGTVLKVSPLPAVSYDILFKTVGVLIPLLFYGILIALAIKPLLAFLITIVFMLNPTLILYENLLYYTFIEAFYVLLAIFFFLRWGKGKKFFDLFLFWISLLCLGMIRSLFHPVFFLITALILTWQIRRTFKEHRITRQFAFSSLLVLIPIIALFLKNAFLFGFFGTSSWDGMNLWTKVNGFSPEELETFHSKGMISSLALKADLKAFQPIHFYFDNTTLKNMPCHHPADCNTARSTGYPNFNHIGYIYLSKQLWKDALHLIAYDPSLFAFYTGGSYCLTLWHSSDSVHALFEKNMEVVKQPERIYRFLYFGFLGVEDRNSVRLWDRAMVVTALFLAVYVSTFIQVFRKDARISPAVTMVCLFCLIIHSYTLLVSSIIEFGENNRFRFPVDSAFLVLTGGNIIIWKALISSRFKNKSLNCHRPFQKT
jgi:hypothetical protein